MKKFDEYQKLMRYKYGYYSFILLISILLLNEFLTSVFIFQWGEDKYVETLILIVMVILVFNVLSTYHNAYFHKEEDANDKLLGLFLFGLFYLLISFFSFTSNPGAFFVNGKVTRNFIQLLVGINFISIPITHFIRTKVEEKRS